MGMVFAALVSLPITAISWRKRAGAVLVFPR
jgi:hypothetical protein